MRLRRLLAVALPPVLLAAAIGCQSREAELLEHHHDAVEVLGLEREGGAGPYLAGTPESFRLELKGRATAIRWSASDGALSASGDRARWVLPQAPQAHLSATVTLSTGEERTVRYDFQILSSEDGTSRARQALLTAPIAVLDGGTSSTGSYCDLAFDTSNNIHLAFRDDSHPSLWHALWNGSSWNVQHVDGMGFNTGGMLSSRFSLALSGTTPHLAYQLEDQGVWYATRSGTTWTRERVDTTLPAVDPRVSLALNPASSNRPTVAYITAGTNGYFRLVVASRTSPGVWAQTMLTFPHTVSTNYDYLAGDVLFSSNGTLYLPVYRSNTTRAYLGTWNGSAAQSVDLNPGLVGGYGFDAAWADGAWAGASKLLLRNTNQVLEVTLGATLGASTVAHSRVEATGSTVGDLAFSGKPYLLHRHGSNLELVTTGAGNYWTYTQLGTATSNATPSLAVSAAGTTHICYQNSGQILFQ